MARDGTIHQPRLFAVIDDHSRVLGHAQWFLVETAEAFVHGLRQAFHKMGLPRALMTDNGAAMKSGEYRHGLDDLGIHRALTPAYTPEWNGKIENFWASVESRLMAMIDPDNPLDLATLNSWTQAWITSDYHQRIHRDIATTPLQRLRTSPSLGRPCPEADRLRFVFQTRITRSQRQSDHTVAVDTVRFQVPSPWHHLDRVTLRYARWDLSRVDLVDPARPQVSLAMLRPVDRVSNARRPRRKTRIQVPAPAGPRPMPPYLEQMLEEQQAQGGIASWLPFDEEDTPS